MKKYQINLPRLGLSCFLTAAIVSPFLYPAPQKLPISASAKIANQRINLEVARTPHQIEKGLMYRTSLAADRGMLFVYEPPQPVSFWMRNTKIPLDMVFLRDGQVKALKTNVPPCTTNPCPTYGPGSKVVIDQVIELRGRRSAELGLKVGDRVNIKFFKEVHRE
jgi:uncharacterized membrane protein (UPF0127 family)